MNQPPIGDFQHAAKHELQLLAFLAALEAKAEIFPRPSLNLLQAAGLARQEIRHSNLLAFFLEPGQPHGLGDELLKQLLHQAGRPATATGAPLSRLKRLLSGYADLQVRREMMNIDVVAWSDKQRFALAIEVKVDASEGTKQLQRYRERMEEEFPGYEIQMLFLTREGTPPADECWSAIAWDSVCTALEQARDRKHNTLSEVALFSIDQYLEFIRKKIVANPIDEELAKVCRELYTQHRHAIDLIIEYGTVSPFAEAAHSFRERHAAALYSYEVRPNAWGFLPSTVAAACKEAGLVVAQDAKYWAQERAIIMWFAREANKLALIVEVGPWPDERRKRLIEELREAAPAAGRVKTTITPTYSRIWSSRVKLNEDAGSDAILGQMGELLSRLDDAIPLFSEIIRTAAKRSAQ